MAQDILAPPPTPPPSLPSATEEYQDNQPGPKPVFTSSTAPFLPQLTLPIVWGPLIVRPHLLYRFLYGNGIESSAGQQQNSIIQQLSPGVLFDLGTHWTLNYTPTLTFYSSSQFRNTVDQSVLLTWGTACGHWSLSGSQSYVSTSDPDVETAGQTSQESFSTALNASYQFNKKISTDLGLSQNLQYFESGQGPTNLLQSLGNSRSWSTMDWLNYLFRSTFSAGIG
ncbi:MAG TPA: hypothetical protein VEN79_05030, partial [Terriglobia bacterium]|nr:hypothetical protein [Terriglobia bacterium]